MKKMRKLLALVLSLAMVFGMATVVSAANQDTDVEAYMSKTYNAEVGHDFTFKFKAEQDTATPGYIHESVALTIGEDNTISFTENDTEATGTSTKTAKLNFADFTQAGVYRYVVTEEGVTPDFTPTDHEALILSQAKYEVLVYVQEETGEEEGGGGLDVGVDPGWDGDHNLGFDSLVLRNASTDASDYKIVKIIVNRLNNNDGTPIEEGEKITDIGPGADTNEFNFENTYVYEAGSGEDEEDPDPENPNPDYDENGSLKVSKMVTNGDGEVNDADREFSFKATFTFPAGTDADSLGGITGNDEEIDLEQGNTYDFTLKHNGNMVFKNLPTGTTVTITETGNPNYKATAVSKMGSKTDQFGTDSKYGDDLTVENQKLTATTNTVEVTNAHLYIPTTGVIINVLPFALMLLLGCGALFLFVFTKTRRSSER